MKEDFLHLKTVFFKPLILLLEYLHHQILQ